MTGAERMLGQVSDDMKNILQTHSIVNICSIDITRPSKAWLSILTRDINGFSYRTEDMSNYN